MDSQARSTREWFGDASAGLRAILPLVPDDRLGDPALGDWDVRSLIGHTCRSYLTIEQYLLPTDTASDPPTVAVASPQEYVRRALGGVTDPEAITERGRAAGRALGEHPTAEAMAIVDRVTDLVNRTPDDANVDCLVGVMTFIDYLVTRAFELTVHGLDLVRALDLETPPGLANSAQRAVVLAVRVGDQQQAIETLMAVTGRTPLPAGFSVFERLTPPAQAGAVRSENGRP